MEDTAAGVVLEVKNGFANVFLWKLLFFALYFKCTITLGLSLKYFKCTTFCGDFFVPLALRQGRSAIHSSLID